MASAAACLCCLCRDHVLATLSRVCLLVEKPEQQLLDVELAWAKFYYVTLYCPVLFLEALSLIAFVENAGPRGS